MALEDASVPPIISISEDWLSLWLMSAFLSCKSVPVALVCRPWSSKCTVLRVGPWLENLILNHPPSLSSILESPSFS